ncbi:hypothetical protein C8R47DRAFT_1083992 [Mycena vitilis]|nr:hypothetical protein C8R47DRAFT_1083992 [Mycena vitilis]
MDNSRDQKTRGGGPHLSGVEFKWEPVQFGHGSRPESAEPFSEKKTRGGGPRLCHMKGWIGSPFDSGTALPGVGTSLFDRPSLLIVRHMNHIIASNKIAVFYFEGIIGILDKADTNSSLKNALLSTGIVKALMHMINLWPERGPRTRRAFSTTVSPSCPGSLPLTPPQCASLLLYGRDAIYDAGESAMDPRFKASSIFQDWAKFVQLTKERVRFARAYDAGEYPSLCALWSVSLSTGSRAVIVWSVGALKRSESFTPSRRARIRKDLLC